MRAYRLAYNHEFFCLDNDVCNKVVDDIACSLNMIRLMRAYNPIAVKLLLAESEPIVKLTGRWQEELNKKLENDRKEFTKAYRIAEIHHEEFEKRIFLYVSSFQ